VYCSERCTKGSCPDGFYCDTSTFLLAELSFCRFGDTEPAEPEVPDEPPRLPCKTDDDCDGDLVCATYMGERDCTMPCAAEDDCAVSLDGVTLDFSTCGTEEGQDREVCLPDPACYQNPQMCIGGFPGL
jgi:hypothetical protein